MIETESMIKTKIGALGKCADAVADGLFLLSKREDHEIRSQMPFVIKTLKELIKFAEMIEREEK
jgi:hypothetical protein